MPLDNYRRLYELRTEEHIDPYPKPKKWREIHREWAKWFIHLPGKNRLSLLRKGGFWLVKQGAALTVLYAVGHYIWTIPVRHKQAEEQKKQAHYQAWQVINSAAGQQTSGGRIEALQDLNKDEISLANLSVPNAYLVNLSLDHPDLSSANFSHSNLYKAKLPKAYLYKANLQNAFLHNAIQAA